MRVGTRGSALALAQARWVADAAAAGRRSRSCAITTLGDRGAAVADKSRWVSELERALLDGRIDVAVHSAKDVPAELAAGLELVAIPPRADPRDAICGAPATGASCPAAPASGPAACAAPPSCARCATTSRSSSSAATSTPGCASWPTARSTRSCSRWPGCSGSAGPTRPAACSTSSCRPPARARWRSRRAPGRSSTAALERGQRPGRDGVRRRRAGARARARRLLQHAGRAPTAGPLDDGPAELTGWVGLPDGSAWLRDRVTGDAGEARRARARSGCSPPGAGASCCRQAADGVLAA